MKSNLKKPILFDESIMNKGVWNLELFKKYGVMKSVSL